MVAIGRCLFLVAMGPALFGGGGGKRVLNEQQQPTPPPPSQPSITPAAEAAAAASGGAIVPLIEDLRFRILRLHGEFLVADGSRVDYRKLLVSDAFASYVRTAQQLQRADPKEVAALTEAERRAAWLNLYNALVMHGMVVGPTIPTSTLARSRFYSATAYNVAGQLLSLDDLEHGLLRGDRASPNPLRWGFWSPTHFQRPEDPRRAWAVRLDPRIHFALNCGAVSCPAIRFYEASSLEEDLQAAAQAFFAGTEVDASTRTVRLSMILKWYQRDFLPSSTSSSSPSQVRERAVLQTLLPWLPPEVREQVQGWLDDGGGVCVEYAPYDWGVNAAV